MNKKLNNLLIGFVGLWTVLVAFYYWYTVSIPDLRNIRYDEAFGLTALFFLYLSVAANPVHFLFDQNFWVKQYKGLQKTLVGITFWFGLIHAYISFFYLLGGFAGLGFLNSRFILGITLSISSLLILLSLVAYYRGWWRNVIYVVGLLITIHALLLGSHFIILSNLIPHIFFVALAVLLFLLAASLDKWMHKSNWPIPKFGLNFILALIIVSVASTYYFNPASALPSASVHAAHLAALAAAQASGQRYTISFTATPEHPQPNQNVSVKFKVYDANTGNEVTSFDTIYEKLIHLVIVDSDLKFFNHIHPEKQGSTFSITTQFPHNGIYHLYTNFQPHGGAEQQVGFSLLVGEAQATLSPVPVDASLTKTFGNYQVSLSTADGKDFNATGMSDASQMLVFNFKDAKTGQPTIDLQPYLGAFGHLVLINEESYNYIHVHPLATDNPNAGGPDVKFLPAALYSKITPGVYRVFGQFRHSDQVFVADFTINVK